MGENFMQDSPRPIYARVGALSAAALLSVSGAFIAGPAMAAPGESQPAATETPAAPVENPGTTAPAGEADTTLAPGLAEALQRDLGMSVEEFLAAGELGKKAADALDRLKATEGFVGIEVLDGGLVITGSGEQLQALADELGATLVDPAAEPSAPAAEEAPSVNLLTENPAKEAIPAPAPEASEAPVEEVAAEAGTKQATDVRSLLSAYGAAVGTDRLQWISGTSASGFTIKVGEPLEAIGARSMAASLTPEAFAAQYRNVNVVADKAPALKSLADENTILNGSGYLIPTNLGVGACSVGFTGFNASGADAIISAGHCADDGAATEAWVEIPSEEEAFIPGDRLGTFGAYSFNGTVDAPGTDVSVIDGINDQLDLLPETSQWTAPGELLSATTVKISGTTGPVVGAPVCKSGRTTFWSCGVITETPAIVNVEGTFVEAVITDLPAAPGDSGGSVISGNLAVGLISAGAGDIVAVADIGTALAAVPGYTVAIHLDAPALTSPENKGTVETDAPITGTAPAGSTVKLSLNGSDREVTAAADGTWSTPAPTLVPDEGKLTITAQAVSGFNKSKVSTFELTVTEAPLPAPAFTTPAKVLRSLDTITGTGVAGATVTVNVDPATTDAKAAAASDLTAEVAEDGNWSVALDEALGYGNYAVSARQDGIEGKEGSAEAALQLAVAPEAPVITAPADGSEFVEGKVPGEITGTATAGLEVVVRVNEADPATVEVDEDGNWSYRMPSVTAGNVAISASQLANEVFSDAAVANVTVVAPAPAPEPTNPPATVNPVPAANPGPGNGGLPNTGASGIGLLAGGGATLLAAGAAALYFSKRRKVTADA